MRNLGSLRVWLPALALVAGCAGPHGGPAGNIPAGGASSVFGDARPDSAPAVVEIATLATHPSGIASDGLGNEWIVGSVPPVLMRMNESSHTKTKFALSSPNSEPTSVALGRNGNGMWLTDYHTNRLGYFRFSDQSLHSYPVPTSGSGLQDIVAGSDNAMWFTERFTSKIGRMNLQHFTISEYTVPNQGDPTEIALGPDGNLWFTEFQGDAVGRITTSGQITIYPLPHPLAAPWGIAAGPDGAIWFTETNAHMLQPYNPRQSPNHVYHGKIARIDLQTHAISEWSIPLAHSFPEQIVTRGSSLWFTDITGYVGRMNPTSHAITEYPVPHPLGPWAIALGTDNELWLTQAQGQRIDKACPDRSQNQCSTGN